MVLLLFSVFVLLHVTTSDRNHIDGSYGSCNHSSRYFSSNTDFLASTPHRLQRLLYGIRTLTTPVEKNPNFIIGNLELTQLTESQKIGHIEPRLRYDENRKAFTRNRNKILTSASEESVGRQNFRERIYIHQSNLLNNIYNKFVGFSSRYNYRKNEANANRFEDRRISGFNYNDRDDRNRQNRHLLEHVERNTQRHAIRDSLRDYSNYDKYTETQLLPQKLVLDKNAYCKVILQNIRRIITDREHIYNREANEIGRGTRDIKLELREISRFRDYVRNKGDETSKIQNDRKNIDRFDLHRKREDIDHHGRTSSSEEKYTTRHISIIYTKIQFRRKYDNYKVNRDMKNRITSKDNNNKNKHNNGNRESFNFEETNRRMNIFKYRNDNGQRSVQKNRLSVCSSFNGRCLEKGNEKILRDNFSTENSQVRDNRRSRRIQRNFDDASNRILKSNRLTFCSSSDVIESDENSLTLTDLGFRSDNIMFRRRQLAKDSSHNRRDIKDNNISNFNDIRHSLKTQLRVWEDRDRTISRIKEKVIVSRSVIRIARISTDYVINQRTRRNDNCALSNRQVTRKIDDERKSTKPSQDRFTNMRRNYTNENRYFTINIFNRKEPRTYKIQHGNSVFEIKWQYLFYALQFVYLLSIIMQIPKNNKRKSWLVTRIFLWKTPAEYLK